MWIEYLDVAFLAGFVVGSSIFYILMKIFTKSCKYPIRIIEGYANRRLLLNSADWIPNLQLNEQYLGIVPIKYADDDVPVIVKIFVEKEDLNANT